MTRAARAPTGRALYLRPRAQVAQWVAIGAQPRVTRILRDGLRLRFWREPRPYDGGAIPVPEGDREWVAEETTKNLERGSWVEVNRKPAFCAPAFIVRRADGKRRVVIDLRYINTHLRAKGVRYDTLRALRHLLPPGGFMISFDLESGYHHIGIHQSDRRYLGFELAGRFFHCAALPFGLASAPRVFTKVMRAMVAHWRGRGVRCLPYLDDFLFCFADRATAEKAAGEIEATLLRLGLSRNTAKGQWVPTQTIDHLGVRIDSVAMRFLATPEREARIREFSGELLHLASRRARMVPKTMLAKFAGLAISTSLAVPLARMFTRTLYDAMAAARTAKARLSSAALTDLRWWHASDWNDGAPILLPAPELTIATDASDTGWGACVVEVAGLNARGFFSAAQRATTIMERELAAVHYALQAFSGVVRGRQVRLLIDNQAAAYGLMNLTLRQAAARQQLLRIHKLARELCVRMLVQWIPTGENGRADALSRATDRNDYMLHPHLFAQLCCRWGTPDVDAFATALNAQVPRFWAAMPHPGAAAVDALAQDLSGLHIYANPPWGLIGPLLDRIAQSPTTEATLVLPFWRSAAWFPQLLSLSDDSVLMSTTADTFLPGANGNSHGIGRPRWNVIFTHIPPRTPSLSSLALSGAPPS